MSDMEEIQQTNELLVKRLLQAEEENELLTKMVGKLVVDKATVLSLANRYREVLIDINNEYLGDVNESDPILNAMKMRIQKALAEELRGAAGEKSGEGGFR